MHANQLLTSLEQAKKLVSDAQGFFEYVRWDSDELPHGEFGPLAFDTYAEEQRAILKLLVTAAEQALTKDKLSSSLTLYATGSAARLEYLDLQSDIDILAILADQPYATSDEASDDFARIKKTMSDYILAHCAAAKLSITQDKVDISGCPSSVVVSGKVERAKVFHQLQELIGNVGKEFEAPWAGFDRASLIFESAVIWSSTADSGRHASISVDNELYKIAEDINDKRFPLSGYCLAEFIGRSGLLAKAAAVRKSATPDKAQKEIAKTLLSRVWTANINLLCLQVLFLRRVICDRPFENGRILEELRGPPMIKALVTIPDHLWAIRSDQKHATSISRLMPGASKKSVADVLEKIEGIHFRVRRGGAESGPPLWYRFLQLMKICHAVRGDGAHLTVKTSEKIKLWNRELANLLHATSSVTLKLCENTSGSAMGSVKLHELLADHIHGLNAVGRRR
jgi:hypothetical protein